MLKFIHDISEVQDFVPGFRGDPEFSEPMLANEAQYRCNLVRSIRQPDTHRTFAVYNGVTMTGLFSFLVLAEERYLEMLVGLSREKEAYREMMDFLRENFPGYGADFVFNPSNHLMTSLLRAQGAAFYPVQEKMVYHRRPLPPAAREIVPYAPSLRDGYLSIHDDSDGRYWTGEKVLAAPEKFRTFLALHEGRVAGYIDVTHCFEENEPYDLYVRPEYRRLGYGRALLTAALEANGSKGMMLLVDADNLPAIGLYDSMGFVKDPLGGSQTAHLQL